MYRITFLGETSDREEATMQQKLRQYTENYATATFCSHNQGENERAKTDDVICWGKKPYVGYFGDAKQIGTIAITDPDKKGFTWAAQ